MNRALLLRADAQGAGRFAKIGIPAPEVMAPFWAFLQESRTDPSMLCGVTLLALVSADRWSLDARVVRHDEAPEPAEIP